jgi:hypothetical protein
MTADEFVLHDMSDFPIVRSRNDAIVPGYAQQWAREMDALLAADVPFVIVFGEGMADEQQEDRKVRAVWLKKNRSRLATLCRAVVAIEPDTVKCMALKAQAVIATKAFGVPMDIVPSRAEAEVRARGLLEPGSD